MIEIDDLIRRAIEDPPAPPPSMSIIAARARSRRRHRLALRAAGASAVIAIVAVTTLTVATLDGRDRGTVQIATVSPSTADDGSGAPDLVGLTLQEATERASAVGWTLVVLDDAGSGWSSTPALPDAEVVTQSSPEADPAGGQQVEVGLVLPRPPEDHVCYEARPRYEGIPDGLPYADESSGLAAARGVFLPELVQRYGAIGAWVGARDGQVWDGDPSHPTVRYADDLQIVLELPSMAQCPDAPPFYWGFPVVFTVGWPNS